MALDSYTNLKTAIISQHEHGKILESTIKTIDSVLKNHVEFQNKK